MIIAIVGHGSIGSKYKEEILKRGFTNKSIIIIDSNITIIKKLREEGYLCYESIQDIDQSFKKIDYAIIANWGPDHIRSAQDISNLGCKRFIIEKPVSSNLEELDLFEKDIQKKSIFATVHHHWKYVGLDKLINEAQSQFELENPVGVRLIGGALGLCTNGIHWLDFAQEILSSNVSTIVSDLDIDYINPRDDSLAFIGGMCSFKMRNKSFIHVSFSNQNSQSARAEIVYKHGIIDICTRGLEGKLKIYKRRQEDLDKFANKITRHGLLKLIGETEFINKRTVPDVLDDLFNSKIPKTSIKRAKIPLKMIIGAIQSSKENKMILWDDIKDQEIRIS